MKTRLGASVVALGLVIVPGVLFASTPGKMVATEYDEATAIVTGKVSGGGTEKVRHTLGTGNGFVEDPNLFPPGACRGIAIRWNLGLFQNRSDAWFKKLLGQAAQSQCTISYVRADAPVDGAYDLQNVTIAP